MVSMKDIAAACEVSVATVSKALNNQGDIGEDTKEKIKNTAKRLGYHPNFSARALKTNRTYNLGVLYKEGSGSGLTHDYFSQVLESFKNTAENSGYDITFLSNSKIRKDSMSYLEHTIYRRMDGVMVAVADYKDAEVIERGSCCHDRLSVQWENFDYVGQYNRHAGASLLHLQSGTQENCLYLRGGIPGDHQQGFHVLSFYGSTWNPDPGRIFAEGKIQGFPRGRPDYQ